MNAGTLEIELMANIARLRKDMDVAKSVVGEATASMSRAADAAKAALASIGSGIGLSQIVQMADTYAKFTAQLRLATQSSREYAAAYGDVKRIATGSQQDLQATGMLYARIANGTRELGTSQKQVAAITETVNLALKVSGATAQEAASAQLQLSQAFASGALRGEEFNAVNEAAPRLMKALADGLGVPVGALKQMASEGKITSSIMADVLPKALADLHEEAQQVQTIGGAFTVLKNNVMEFVGVQANASGGVAVLTGAIGMLANNLGLLAGAVATIAAAKLGSWIGTMVADTYAWVTSTMAARAATIAAAEAEVASVAGKLAQLGATQAMIVVAREEAIAKLASANANITAAQTAMAAASAAGAQSFALRALRLATAELTAAEAARTAMVAELALLGQQQARVAAQVAAATTAQTAAQSALTAATSTGAVAAGIGARALALLGGPIGAVITLLGLAATAWAWYSSKTEEASAKAAGDTEESTYQIIASIEKQNEKLRERIELGKQAGMSAAAQQGGKNVERLAAILKDINDLKAKGNKLDAAGQIELITKQGIYDELNRSLGTGKALQAELNEGARATQIADWFAKNGTGAQRMAAELEELKKKFGTIPPEMEKLVREKYADKGIEKEATAYASLIAAIRAKTEENKLELAVGENATESQKARIKLDQELASGKLKLSAAHLAAVHAALADQEASEKLLAAKKAEREVARHIDESTAARTASSQALEVEYKLYGQSNDAREIAMVAIKAQAELEKYLIQQKAAGLPITDEQAAALRAEADARAKVEQATMAQSKALGYASQLAMENKKFAAESISDPKARADALLQIDADIWRERIKNAGEGTEAQKKLQDQYNTWYANQSKQVVTAADAARAKELMDILSTIDDAAREAAAGMADSFGQVGKAIGSLTTALTGYQKTQAAIAAELASVMSDPKADESKRQQAQARAAEANARAQVKQYGDMASAAKGFFKENSAGYKVMEGVEKAYRAAEMAMAIESMVKKLFFAEAVVSAEVAGTATKIAAQTTATGVSVTAAGTEASAWGVAAFAKTLASLPFPFNLAAGAAVVAALVAAGVAMTGGGSGASVDVAKDRQAAQGTGSVLGDSKAKSDSIARSLDMIEKYSGAGLDYSAGMLDALRDIRSGIGGLGNLLARGYASGATMGNLQNTSTPLGGTFGAVAHTAAGAGIGYAAGAGLTAFTSMGAIGGPIGMVIGAVVGFVVSKFSKTTTEVVDQGIQIYSQTLGAAVAEGIKAGSYADVKSTTRFLGIKIGGGTSHPTGALSDEMTQQFTKVVASMRSGVIAAANALGQGGDEFIARLDAIALAVPNISLKGLSGEEIQKALEAVFGKMGDDIARSALGGFESFQKVGEGYMETVMRLATDYQMVDAIFATMGKTFGQVGVGSVAARERLVELAGGLESLASKAAFFQKNFFTESEQVNALKNQVNPRLEQFGLSTAGQDAMKQFKNYVLALDTTTEAGARAYNTLMELAPAFKEIVDAGRALVDERKGLQDQLDELTMSSTDLLKKQRDALDESNRALFDQVQAATKAKAVADERKGLQDQLDQLTMSSTALLKKQRDALDESNRALFDQAQAARDRAKTESLSIELMQAQGNAIGALNLQRSAELQALSETDRLIKQQIYAEQDHAKTAALSLRLLELQGRGQEALNESRAAELAKLSETDAQIQRQIYVQEDLKSIRALNIQLLESQYQTEASLAMKRADILRGMSSEAAAIQRLIFANEDAQSAVDRSMSRLSKAVNAQKEALQNAYQRQVDAFKEKVELEKQAAQASLDAASTAASAIHGVFDRLSSAARSMRELTRVEGQAILNSALQYARQGGNLAKFDGLEEALAAVGKDASSRFATFAEYKRDQALTASTVSALTAAAGGQVSVAEMTLSAIQNSMKAADSAAKAQLDAMADANKASIAYLDGILNGAQAQLDALRGIDNSVQSVSTALAAFGSSITKAGAVQASSHAATKPAGQSVEAVYQELLGRAPDVAGLMFWRGAFGDTIDEREKLEMLKAARPELAAKEKGPEAWREFLRNAGVPGYATGGLHSGGLRLVGENGPELEVTGSARYFSNGQTADLLRGGSGDASAAAGEVAALRRVMESRLQALEDALVTIARHTGDSADKLDRIDQIGVLGRTE